MKKLFMVFIVILMTFFMSCSKPDDDKLPCEVEHIGYVTVVNNTSVHIITFDLDYGTPGNVKIIHAFVMAHESKSFPFSSGTIVSIYMESDLKYTSPEIKECEKYTFTINK
jgi:hypothetical protein